MVCLIYFHRFGPTNILRMFFGNMVKSEWGSEKWFAIVSLVEKKMKFFVIHPLCEPVGIINILCGFCNMLAATSQHGRQGTQLLDIPTESPIVPCRSVCLSVDISFCLSVFLLSVALSVLLCLSVRFSSYISVYLPACLSSCVCLSGFPLIFLSTCLPVCMLL